MLARRTAFLAALALPAIARAQAPGGRAVRIIVPYGPGGSSDIVARTLAQHAGTTHGLSFVVENRGGGASIPGTQAVATAAPDGTTIGTADNALVVNPALFKDRMPYEAERDIAGIGLAVTAPLLLLANANAPARTLAEVMAEARANPGLGISHGGIGTPTHLASVQFQLASGLELTQVGYRGGGPQLVGLVSGEVRYGFVAISSAFNHIEAGRLRPIAATGPARSPQLPQVPTFAEAGQPGVDVVGWWGFIAPGATPPPLLAQLHAQIVAPAQEAAVKTRLEALGYSVVASQPAEFQAQIRREIAQWREVVARAGITVE